MQMGRLITQTHRKRDTCRVLCRVDKISAGPDWNWVKN